jgi:hypothetical protein
MMHPVDMAGRAILRSVLALVVVALACLGCDDADQAAPPTIRSLNEPWQEVPFAIDPAVVAAADPTCRDPKLGMRNAGVPLVLVDARGGGAMYLLYANASSESECFVVLDVNGSVANRGGGSSTSTVGGAALPVLAANEIQSGGGGSQSGDLPGQTMSFASGRAGAAITRVEVILIDNKVLQASLNGGWFAAWWPTDRPVKLLRGYDGSGTLVGTSP